MNKQKACIICSEEITKGNEVVEDKIIDFIRKVKSKLGVVKGYKLYVCDNCLETYEKKRKRFERNILLYGGLGLVLTLLLLFFNFSIGSFLVGILLFLVMLLLAIMGYVPQIKKNEKTKVSRIKKNEVKKNETKTKRKGGRSKKK